MQGDKQRVDQSLLGFRERLNEKGVEKDYVFVVSVPAELHACQLQVLMSCLEKTRLTPQETRPQSPLT
jgi:hypothetical protein